MTLSQPRPRVDSRSFAMAKALFALGASPGIQSATRNPITGPHLAKQAT